MRISVRIAHVSFGFRYFFKVVSWWLCRQRRRDEGRTSCTWVDQGNIQITLQGNQKFPSTSSTGFLLVINAIRWWIWWAADPYYLCFKLFIFTTSSITNIHMIVVGLVHQRTKWGGRGNSQCGRLNGGIPLGTGVPTIKVTPPPRGAPAH